MCVPVSRTAKNRDLKTDSFVDMYWPMVVGSSEAQRRSVEALTRQEPKDAQTGSFGALNGKKRGAREFGIGCRRTHDWVRSAHASEREVSHFLAGSFRFIYGSEVI